MSQQHATSNPQAASDEIDLLELFNVIWRGKWIIIAITFVFSIASIFYALSLSDVYKSEALLAPASEQSNLKMPGQIGGLAALAGVNIGSRGDDKTKLALEVIKSRVFISNFIEKYDLLVPLMASEGWNRSDDSLLIDDELYDIETQQWIREVKAPFQAKPSLLEAHKAFIKRLSVSEDAATGMIKVSIEHFSPYIAQKWVSDITKELNKEMRERDLLEANNSIAYLNTQILQTNIADMRTMLYSMIEEQTKTLMLANVREEYVFKTVDPAVVSEIKSKPGRVLIVLFSFFAGFFLSSMFVVLRYFAQK